MLGKKISLKLLETKLNREWTKNGRIKITDLTEGYFLVRLSSQDYFRHALFEGPMENCRSLPHCVELAPFVHSLSRHDSQDCSLGSYS